MSISSDIGQWVRAARQARRWSRRELADEMNSWAERLECEGQWSAATIVTIEAARRGRRLVVEELVILAAVFDIDPADLLNRAGAYAAATELALAPLSDKAVR